MGSVRERSGPRCGLPWVRGSGSSHQGPRKEGVPRHCGPTNGQRTTENGRSPGVRELMFEALTAGAERALARAEWLARRRGAAGVEPLDLLAALTVETESRAVEWLVEFGVETSRLRAALDPAMLEELAQQQDQRQPEVGSPSRP